MEGSAAAVGVAAVGLRKPILIAQQVAAEAAAVGLLRLPLVVVVVVGQAQQVALAEVVAMAAAGLPEGCPGELLRVPSDLFAGRDFDPCLFLARPLRCRPLLPQ